MICSIEFCTKCQIDIKQAIQNAHILLNNNCTKNNCPFYDRLPEVLKRNIEQKLELRSTPISELERSNLNFEREYKSGTTILEYIELIGQDRVSIKSTSVHQEKLKTPGIHLRLKIWKESLEIKLFYPIPVLLHPEIVLFDVPRLVPKGTIVEIKAFFKNISNKFCPKIIDDAGNTLCMTKGKFRTPALYRDYTFSIRVKGYFGGEKEISHTINIYDPKPVGENNSDSLQIKDINRLLSFKRIRTQVDSFFECE
jgi:hypothetical protein